MAEIPRRHGDRYRRIGRKSRTCRQHGCAHTIQYTKENFVERVREITAGEGVPVVYDSVGKDTWEGSLDCLQPLGLMVSFGNSSGPVAPINIGQLATKGSLYLTRPALATYTAKRDDLEAMAKDLFSAIANGVIKVNVRQLYALKDASQAHRDLEARKTTGSTVLTP